MILESFIGKKLAAFEFAGLAFQLADNLPSAEVRLRREPGTKQFLEEILPLAVLAKTWERTGRHLFVEYCGPNKPQDAIIRLQGTEIDQGWLEPLYHVDVTSALFERAHYEREALAHQGSVFHDPNIQKSGSKHKGNRHIVSHATAEDMDAPRQNLEHWVLNALRNKAKNSYPKPSMLIVNAEPSRPLGLTEWCSVIAAVSPASRSSQFDVVVLVDWYNSAAYRCS